MGVRIGNTEITKVPIGNTLVDRIYVGTERILPVPPINQFVENIVNLGGSEDVVREGYKNVDNYYKDKASYLIFPSHADKYRVYAMNNSTGNAIPVYFSRASQGTFFDRDLNLQTAGLNEPRIDYGNYSKDVKILFEKEATNIVTKSNWSTYASTATYDESRDVFTLTKNDAVYSAIYFNNSIFNINETYALSYLSKKISGEYRRIGGHATAYDIQEFTINGIKQSNGYGIGTDIISYTEPYYTNVVFTYYNSSASTPSFYIQPNRASYLPSVVEVWNLNIQKGSEVTSYIPIKDTESTRSADEMKIGLSGVSDIYIKTVKNEYTLSGVSGVVNISEYIDESDGILYIAVIGEIDDTYFDNQFVKGHPKMTSNTTPAPYVAYSNSSVNTTYASWKAFDGISGLNSRWVSLSNAFNPDGSVIGVYPYLWINQGSTANRRRYCKMKVQVPKSETSGYAPSPGILSIGYSNTNNNDYIYQRTIEVTPEIWEKNNGVMEFYFDPPSVPMQYWSISVIQNNGNTNVHVGELTLYEDVNNR